MSVILFFRGVHLLQTQNDYMRIWLADKRDDYLDRILKSYAGPDTSPCHFCHVGKAVWRCLTCIDRRPVCAFCCRNMHQRDPFHLLEKWNGRFFKKAALWQVGVKIYLGHFGNPCPRSPVPSFSDHAAPISAIETLGATWNVSSAEVLERVSLALKNHSGHAERTLLQEVAQTVGTHLAELISKLTEAVNEAERESDAMENASLAESAERESEHSPDPSHFPFESTSDLPPIVDLEEDDWEDENDIFGVNPRIIPHMPTIDNLGNKFAVIVHRDGYHHLPVVPCSCSDSAPDHQFLDLNLYPSTYLNIKTLFTFDVLNDQRWDNLECKTSYYQYHQKLRRVTSPSCPKLAPNRLVELRRVARQWRNLKQRKWFWAQRDSARSIGSMAQFCPACPQPGINLPPGWEAEAKENPLDSV